MLAKEIEQRGARIYGEGVRLSIYPHVYRKGAVPLACRRSSGAYSVGRGLSERRDYGAVNDGCEANRNGASIYLI
jgi:hypothetical protein